MNGGEGTEERERRRWNEGEVTEEGKGGEGTEER